MDLLPRARRRLACAAFLIFAAVPALGAERVSVTGEAGGGGGRLEFVWPQPVQYDARIVFGRLLVRFSQAGDFDFSALRDAMPQLLGEPKVVADGTVVAFPLRVPVSVRHDQDGARVSIELFDEQGLTVLETAAGPAAEAAPARAAPPPEVAEAAAPVLRAEPLADLEVDGPADRSADISVETAADAPENATQDAAAGDPSETPGQTQAAETPGETPPLETAAGTSELETIGLRVGEHPGFSRFVFDWPSRVAYEIEQYERRVIVDFAAAAGVDLSGFRRQAPRNVSEITTETSGSSLRVTLILPDTYRVRHFVNGSHVVVDVISDAEAGRISIGALVPLSEPERAPASLAEAAPEPQEPPDAATAMEQRAEPTGVSAVEPAVAPAAVPETETAASAAQQAQQAEQAAQAAPDASVTLPPEVPLLPSAGDAPSDLPGELSGELSADLSGDQPADQPADLAADVPAGERAAGAPQVATVEPLQTLGTPQEPTAGQAGAQDGARPPLAAAVSDQGAAGIGVLSRAELGAADAEQAAVAPESARRPILLQFDWPTHPGRAAVFRRGRHLWIAFDQPLAATLGREIAEAMPDLAPVERLTAENDPAAAILRLNLPWAFVPKMRRAERGWIVELESRADEPETALTVEYATEESEPRLRFRVDDAASVLRVRDPDLGDLVAIVPVPAAGEGLKRDRQFLQFRALATYQGLAFLPLSDGLIVEGEAGGVVVRDAAGLLISPGADRDRALRHNKDFESGLRLDDGAAGRPGEPAGALDPARHAALKRDVAVAHALDTLRQAVSEPSAAARRQALFAELVFGLSSERLAPDTAYRLYQRFESLTPAGAEGDRLIARLVDRLAAAGEIGQAAQLLQDQVAHRLSGAAKVRAGARLALLRLAEAKPVLALTALNASLPEDGLASLPPVLERDRRHLRSRALAALGESAQARALIADDDSEEALRLEAELLWTEQDWPAVAGTLEKLAPPPGEGAPLSATDGEVLFHLAVAYGLSGQRDAVSRIRERYGAAMADTAWREDFARLTSTQDKADLIALADKLSGPARGEAFKARALRRLAPESARAVE